MELYCLTDKKNYEVIIENGSGQYYTTCPICSAGRSRRGENKKCLSWNRYEEIGYCHHCYAKFVKARDYEKENTSSQGHNKQIKALKRPAKVMPRKINTMLSEYIEKFLSKESNLGRYLKKHYTEEQIDQAMEKYKLGITKDRSTIYWYIDNKDRLRSGKIIQYNEKTGKRVKNNGNAPEVTWFHSLLKRDKILPPEWSLDRCLFGEHLLKSNPEAIVCLVEGDKTAFMASMEEPDYIWLATSGKGNFTEDVCQCLKGRKVIIFPDLGATKEWEEKAEVISKAVGCQMIINDILEQEATPEQREKGLDIADFYLATKQANESPKEFPESKKENLESKKENDPHN